jgi:uncharacterized membrane protein
MMNTRRRRPLLRTGMIGGAGSTAMGPVQLLVIGLPDAEPHAGITDELEWLRENDIMRLVDLLIARKDADGNLSRLETSDLSQDDAVEVGAVVGALIGYGAAGEEGAEVGATAGAGAAADGSILGDDVVWFADDAIPNDRTVAVALIEHRWAVPLQEAIGKAGGVTLADAWVHPSDLVAIGAMSADEMPRASG